MNTLSTTTVGHAVDAVTSRLNRANRGDRSWRGAVAHADRDTSLLSLTRDIWYVAHGLYVLDRSGHIASDDFDHQVSAVTVAPGTYFFGTFTIQGGASTSSTNLLLYLANSGTHVATGDIGVRSVLADEIPLLTDANAALDDRHGVAAIVSPAMIRRGPRGHRDDNLRRITDLVPRHAEWQVRANITAFLADPTEAAINFVVNEVAGRAAALVAGGPLTMAYFLAREGTQTVESVIIGSRARATADEIDIAAQAVARQLVALVCREIIGRGMARAGTLLRGGRGPHVGAAGPRRQPRNLAYNPRGAFAQQCVAITAAVVNNVGRRGFGEGPGDIEAAHGSTRPVRSGRGSNPLVATAGRAMDYITRATGRLNTVSSLAEMNARPGEYIVFLNDNHVYYTRVRTDGWCTIVDAQIGRGWGGPTASAAWRRMLGQTEGGPAARGRIGPRPHPGIAPKLSDNRFQLWRLNDP
ncbi:hypothetical protein [Nocardia sp. NPDC050710]|uniref:hypothetical protein n=1 Tax=Nocardia sp. NPDC050710 TaxID=3157220 RepID=UPI0033DB8FA6